MNCLILYMEIIPVCTQIHTKPINTRTQCWQKVVFLNIKLVVHTVTTVLWLM